MDKRMIANRLLLSRRDTGYNQEELADMVGVSQSTYSRLERGNTKTIDIQVMERLADVLGVSLLYLLGKTDDPLADIPEEPDAITEENGLFVVNDDLRELSEIYVTLKPHQRHLFLELARMFISPPGTTG